MKDCERVWNDCENCPDFDNEEKCCKFETRKRVLR
jgi:hypothetical protein